MQCASRTCIYCRAWIAVLSCAAPAAFDPRDDKERDDFVRDSASDGERAWLVPMAALVALGLLWVGGAARLGLAETETAPGPDPVMMQIGGASCRGMVCMSV